MSEKIIFKPLRSFLLLTALFLAVAGCGPDPFFIPVISIDGVPDTGAAGTPLALSGTVSPSFASNNAIVWLVVNAGTTEASVSGNILKTNASGTVLIKAKIANGLAEGMDYTQDFRIVISNINNDNIITGVEGLRALLENLPANTTNSPHAIKLIINNVSDFENLKAALDSAQDKYVHLDISKSNITEIPESAFYDSVGSKKCVALTGIILPDIVEIIMDRAFENCVNLAKINIPNNVTSIGEYAFADCEKLTDVTIGIRVEKIGKQAFYYCSSLTSITIPDSVIYIGDSAFAYCSNLNSVKFERDDVTFGNGAFQGDLQAKYQNGGKGTYNTANPGYNAVWIKQ